MIETAKGQALHYLMIRMRSRQEMVQYLQKKGYDDEIISQVLLFLEEYDYLNDIKFCQLWVEERILLNPCGRQKMRQELRKKGISSATISAILTEYYSEDEEEAQARKLVEKKFWSGAERGKVGRYLYNKGFSPYLIERILENMDFDLFLD